MGLMPGSFSSRLNWVAGMTWAPSMAPLLRSCTIVSVFV